MGGIEDPEDGPAVASTIFVAVFVYIVSISTTTSRLLPPWHSSGVSLRLRG